jgi:hypothetical protein
LGGGGVGSSFLPTSGRFPWQWIAENLESAVVFFLKQTLPAKQYWDFQLQHLFKMLKGFKRCAGSQTLSNGSLSYFQTNTHGENPDGKARD